MASASTPQYIWQSQGYRYTCLKTFPSSSLIAVLVNHVIDEIAQNSSRGTQSERNDEPYVIPPYGFGRPQGSDSVVSITASGEVGDSWWGCSRHSGSTEIFCSWRWLLLLRVSKLSSDANAGITLGLGAWLLLIGLAKSVPRDPFLHMVDIPLFSALPMAGFWQKTDDVISEMPSSQFNGSVTTAAQLTKERA